jgi:hypothetical protein
LNVHSVAKVRSILATKQRLDRIFLGASAGFSLICTLIGCKSGSLSGKEWLSYVDEACEKQELQMGTRRGKEGAGESFVGNSYEDNHSYISYLIGLSCSAFIRSGVISGF